MVLTYPAYAVVILALGSAALYVTHRQQRGERVARPLQRAPPMPVPPATLNLPIQRRKVLGGVINEYYHAS